MAALGEQVARIVIGALKVNAYEGGKAQENAA